MRQYTNQQQSGTTTTTNRREPNPMDSIIDRVMLIAKRLATAEQEIKSLNVKIGNFESTIKAQDYKIKMQDEKIKDLEKPVAKTPTPPRRKPTAKKTST